MLRTPAEPKHEFGADSSDEVSRPHALTKAIESRTRTLHPFDAGTILDSPAPGQIFVRSPTIWEEIDARVWAARFSAREAGEAIEIEESAQTDLATLHIVAYAVLKREGDVYEPAFGPPRWLAKRLKADEIARLLDLINEVRLRDAGAKREPSADDVAALAQEMLDTEPDQLAELVLRYTKDDLAQRFRVLSLLWWDLLMDAVGFDDQG